MVWFFGTIAWNDSWLPRHGKRLARVTIVWFFGMVRDGQKLTVPVARLQHWVRFYRIPEYINRLKFT